VANDDEIRRNQDQPVTFNVLANDTDPDGDVIQVTAFSPTTGGQLINQGGGVFTYVPRSGFLGVDTFSYTIIDTGNNSDTALVRISVNQPPVLANNQLLVVDLSDPQATSISRDTLLAVDPDGPPSQVQYIITQGTQRGDLLRRGSQTEPLRVGDRFTQENIDNGSIGYDGNGPAGADEFIFAVTDGIGTLPQAFFNITLVDRTLNTTPGNATNGSDLGEAIVGTDVNDTILGAGGRDVIRGLGGNDLLDGGTGNDVIDGGDGNDTLLGQEGNDSLVGGSGSDCLDGAAGLNTLEGDDGNDTLIGGDESNTLSGGKGNDSLTSGLGSDSLVGGIGNDTLNGNAGEDTLRGDEGQDVIFGGVGRDFIRGGEDDDTLLGQDNSDVIAGDQGNDSISGDQGDDTLLGDTGINSLSGGNDTISGGVGNDSIFGEKGNDSLIGEQGNDSIFGGDNDDVIFGREDNDLMFGDGGNDSIRGGIGDDTLAGGAGGDLLISDDGNDVFYYLNPGEGVDIINDFDQAGNDRFLIVSGTNNFPGLVSNVGTSTPLQSIIVTSLGSEGDNITGRQLIIFRDTFDDVQAVNAQLANQNGSNDSSALIVYRNNLSFPGFPGNYVLAFDPDLSDDSLPAFNLGILASIDPSTDNISTIIGSDDFTII
jgi:Ca2+-binding RTX toxin-like protein